MNSTEPGSELEALLKSEHAKRPELRFWGPYLTPAFPAAWPVNPDTPLFYYAYGLDRPEGVRDAVELRAPWGRIERLASGALRFRPIDDPIDPGAADPFYTPADPQSLGLQGERPMASHERALYAEIDRAGGFEALLGRASEDVEAALLIRRGYCQWCALNGAVAYTMNKYHKALASFVDCANLTAPPLANASFFFDDRSYRDHVERADEISALLQPAFEKLELKVSSLTFCDAALSPALPEAWPPAKGGGWIYVAYATALDTSLPGDPLPLVMSPWAWVERSATGELSLLRSKGRFEQLPTRAAVTLSSPFDEVLRAGGFESLIGRAPDDARARELLQRTYLCWFRMIGPLGERIRNEFVPAFFKGLSA